MNKNAKVGQKNPSTLFLNFFYINVKSNFKTSSNIIMKPFYFNIYIMATTNKKTKNQILAYFNMLAPTLNNPLI
jgi:hypothetical protein